MIEHGIDKFCLKYAYLSYSDGRARVNEMLCYMIHVQCGTQIVEPHSWDPVSCDEQAKNTSHTDS